jgi:hypothetical protein
MVQDLKAGIADGLADHQPRFGLDRRAERVEVARLDETCRDAKPGKGMRQQIDSAAIER